MRRTIPLIISTAVVAIPISTTFFGTPATHAATRVIAPVHAVQGPSAAMRWGPVQATIVVQGKRITDVKITAPTERPRSAIINNRAIPLLRQEVLRAQTANVPLISGATMTSKAFISSLQAAMRQAHL